MVRRGRGDRISFRLSDFQALCENSRSWARFDVPSRVRVRMSAVGRSVVPTRQAMRSGVTFPNWPRAAFSRATRFACSMPCSSSRHGLSGRISLQFQLVSNHTGLQVNRRVRSFFREHANRKSHRSARARLFLSRHLPNWAERNSACKVSLLGRPHWSQLGKMPSLWSRQVCNAERGGLDKEIARKRNRDESSGVTGRVKGYRRMG